MKYLLTIGLALVVMGCSANTIRTASITEAHKEFESEDYEEALELIILAETVKDTTPEMRAALTYLKAQTLEKLGQQNKAITLYEYLKEQHADSQYGYLATKRLNNGF